MRPTLARDDLHQVLLDLFRCILHGQLEPPRDSVNMRVHHHAFVFLEPRPQHDVCGLARHPRQRQQLVHLLRDLAAKFADYLARRAHNRFRFIAEEPGGSDVSLDLLRLHPRQRLRRRVFAEQLRGGFVDALVGALRGKNRRHQQFPCARMSQRAGHVRIRRIQPLQNLAHTLRRSPGNDGCPTLPPGERGPQHAPVLRVLGCLGGG